MKTQETKKKQKLNELLSNIPVQAEPIHYTVKLFDSELQDKVQQIKQLLDSVYKDYQSEDNNLLESLQEVVHHLNKLRAVLVTDQWKYILEKAVWQHPFCEIVNQDPCTKHSHDQPRGYAGDAGLIDYYYKQDSFSADPDTCPDQLKWTQNKPSGRAVRNRAVLMAQTIDSVCARHSNPRIMSVACGHLVEAALSNSVFEEKFDQFIAFDQDESSLAKVNRQFKR